MQTYIERIERDGLTAEIYYDTDPQSPSDWDNVGQIAYLKSGRHVLGTEPVSSDRMDEIRDGIESGELVGLPVFAYIHGGATIQCGLFGDPWDSGQSGFVYCTKEKALSEFGNVESAAKCLEGEVETFDQYLRGDVYGYIIEDENGEHLDSCWGFYGLEWVKEEANSSLDFHANKSRAARRFTDAMAIGV